MTWRTSLQRARARPSVLALAVAGLLNLAAAPIIAVTGAPLLAQLVAGLAVPLLMLAVYLSLFPLAPLGDDDGGADGGGGGIGDRRGGPDGPTPPRRPDAGIDWDRFEREFWDHVEQDAVR